MEHTKGEWKVDGQEVIVGDKATARIIAKCGGHTMGIQSLIDENKTNAERIVKAVNCHDDLVEALKELPEPKSLLEDAAYTGGDVPKKWINDRGHFNDGYNQALKDVAERRERALAKAENS